jgi:thymidine phosphorylase
VGLTQVVRLGTDVRAGQPLAVVHAARPDAADRAVRAVRAAITVAEEGSAADVPALIRERIG